MNGDVLEFLMKRRSVLANNLCKPGPSTAEIKSILQVASRVPDHKKLVPWRFIIFEGDSRRRFGEILARACVLEEKMQPSSDRLETERQRFLRAPLVIAVVARLNDRPAVPEWEQILSTGAACQNLVLAANGFGFASQWITEWYAYSPHVVGALGLDDNERVAGFIYIGTAREKPSERARPDLDQIVTRWE